MRQLFLTVKNRLYSDFLMPSRIPLWRSFLETALQNGYVSCSIEEFWDLISKNEFNPKLRYLIIRHDIDTDCRTAARMWQVEQQLGVRSSYYFRLSTIDLGLMARIAESGSEVSYHYEELSSIIKKLHLRSREQVTARLPDMRALFRQNLCLLRKKTGLPMRVVAAHGDWINRHLGIPNTLILDDEGFRQEVNVDLEVYDQALTSHFTSRFVDSCYPKFWRAGNPVDAILQGDQVVNVLVHPRNWMANVTSNLREDAMRAVEWVCWQLPNIGV